MTKISFVYPTIWRRIGAFFIDTVLISILVLILTLGKGFQVSLGFAGEFWKVTFYNGVLFYIVFFFYFFLQEALFHTSIGKKLLKLEVRSQIGEYPSLVHTFFRNLIKPIEMFFGGIASILLSNKGLSIGDRLAGTVVVSNVKDKKVSQQKPAKISKMRMVFGILAAILSIYFFVETCVVVPKVVMLDDLSRNMIMSLLWAQQNNNSTYVYTNASDAFKKMVKEQDLKSMLDTMETDYQLSKQLNPMGTLVFYQWLIGTNKAEVTAKTHLGYDFALTFVYENNKWKLYGFHLRQPK